MINKISLLLLGFTILFVLPGCSDDNKSDLQLDGDTWLTVLELDDNYQGIIDRTTKTVTVAVPEIYQTDAMKVTAIEASEGAVTSIQPGDLVPVITTSEDALVTPASGQAVDFTDPVDFKVTYNTASAVYKVTVIPTDAPSAVYVGLAASMDQLNAEEKEAAIWMLNNIANSQYISFEDVQAGRIDLSECKLMWWHLHIDGGIDTMDKFDKAASQAVNALVRMKELYNDGMNLLLTRYATYYAAKLGATKDGNNPNNCWGQSEESGEIAGGPWNFFIAGHESHPIYQNLIMNSGENDKVYTCDAGYRITNSTAQWHIGSDWGGYDNNDVWREKTGGVDLGYGGDGAIVVWEYLPEETKGGIVCIGSGCYDWYAFGVDASGDKYHGNVGRMTENAINYLMSK